MPLKNSKLGAYMWCATVTPSTANCKTIRHDISSLSIPLVRKRKIIFKKSALKPVTHPKPSPIFSTLFSTSVWLLKRLHWGGLNNPNTHRDLNRNKTVGLVLLFRTSGVGTKKQNNSVTKCQQSNLKFSMIKCEKNTKKLVIKLVKILYGTKSVL